MTEMLFDLQTYSYRCLQPPCLGLFASWPNLYRWLNMDLIGMDLDQWITLVWFLSVYSNTLILKSLSTMACHNETAAVTLAFLAREPEWDYMMPYQCPTTCRILFFRSLSTKYYHRYELLLLLLLMPILNLMRIFQLRSTITTRRSTKYICLLSADEN